MSDCAAEVVAVGDKVERFGVGDHVAPTLDVNLKGDVRDRDAVVLGGEGPGVLTEYAVFEEEVLVMLPRHLGWEEVGWLESCHKPVV